MSSLQSSFALLSTSHYRNPASSKPFSAKPSTHARRSNAFHVSCNGGDDQKPSRFDRRNMLLGLGGLYGAANLIPDPKGASASPLLAPDLKACGEARDVGTGNRLDVHCCPPVADTIIDYELPDPPCELRVRPAAHQVSEEYISKFNKAIGLMKALDKTDPTDPRGFTQQANIHCAYCNGAHNQVGFPNLDFQVHSSWLFFPFHRWYLYFYERIMRDLLKDDTFCLPFWNWDNPEGMGIPQYFFKDQLSDDNRNPDCFPPAIIDLTLSREKPTDPQKIQNNLSSMYSENIRSVHSTLDFMGQAYRAGDQPGGNKGMGSSERGSHIAAHAWVGNPKKEYSEDMGNFYSAGRDPLFFSHHSNVDRMWSIWRTLPTKVPKDIQDPDYLNASFLFYDGNKQLVRVRAGDCTDHTKMGYKFQEVDIPWLNYKPLKKDFKADTDAMSKKAVSVDNFPLSLKETTRVLVRKSGKGKLNEALVLENIVTDASQIIKFDVYINDQDDYPQDVHKAEYAGSFAQVKHKNKSTEENGNIELKLRDIYEDINVADDLNVVVTLVPRSHGEAVSIGGLKIINLDKKPAAQNPVEIEKETVNQAVVINDDFGHENGTNS